MAQNKNGILHFPNHIKTLNCPETSINGLCKRKFNVTHPSYKTGNIENEISAQLCIGMSTLQVGENEQSKQIEKLTNSKWKWPNSKLKRRLRRCAIMHKRIHGYILRKKVSKRKNKSDNSGLGDPLSGFPWKETVDQETPVYRTMSDTNESQIFCSNLPFVCQSDPEGSTVVECNYSLEEITNPLPSCLDTSPLRSGKAILFDVPSTGANSSLSSAKDSQLPWRTPSGSVSCTDDGSYKHGMRQRPSCHSLILSEAESRHSEHYITTNSVLEVHSTHFTWPLSSELNDLSLAETDAECDAATVRRIHCWLEGAKNPDPVPDCLEYCETASV